MTDADEDERQVRMHLAPETASRHVHEVGVGRGKSNDELHDIVSLEKAYAVKFVLHAFHFMELISE